MSSNRLAPLRRSAVLRQAAGNVLARLAFWCVVGLFVALLTACSSFNLGAMAYCPHGQACALRVVPPEVAASGTQL